MRVLHVLFVSRVEAPRGHIRHKFGHLNLYEYNQVNILFDIDYFGKNGSIRT